MIISIPQRWIVCALCDLAVAFFEFDDVCYHKFARIGETAVNKINAPNEGCPFLFSDGFSHRNEVEGLTGGIVSEVYSNQGAMATSLSAYHIGKILAGVPAGMLSDAGHSRSVFGGSMLLMVVSNLIFSTIGTNVVLIIAVGFFDGVSEGLIYPSIYTLISHWSMPSERHFYTSLVMIGLYHGDFTGRLLYNVLFVHLGLELWNVCNIVNSLVGIVLLCFSLLFIFEPPEESQFVRQHESGYLRRRSTLTTITRVKEIPWKKVWSSRPFLSLALAFCSVDWMSWQNIEFLPVYQKIILRLPQNFSNNSLVMKVAAVPSALVGGLLADWVIQRNLLSNTAVKKSFSFTSVLVASILHVTFPIAGCDYFVFWILSISSAFVLGLAVPVIYSAPIDLSPQHSGLLMGILVGIRAILSLCFFELNQFLKPDTCAQNQWRITFLFNSIVSFALMIPFICFGSGDAQSWVYSNGHPNISFHKSERPSVESDLQGTATTSTPTSKHLTRN